MLIGNVQIKSLNHLFDVFQCEKEIEQTDLLSSSKCHREQQTQEADDP